MGLGFAILLCTLPVLSSFHQFVQFCMHIMDVFIWQQPAFSLFTSGQDVFGGFLILSPEHHFPHASSLFGTIGRTRSG